MTDSDRSAKPLFVMGGLLFAAVLAVAAWNVELPYLAYSPGPVADAADSIVAEGVEVHPPEGELLMLTIITPDVNLFEALIAGVDPTIDLVRKASVRRPGETDEEYRNRVLQQMDNSNFVATAVALDYLGYDMVPTEVVVNDIVPGVPAEQVLELGDSIVGVMGAEVKSIDDLRSALKGRSPGDLLPMRIERGGNPMEVLVELAEREDEPGVAMIGVELGELTDPPFPLRIQEGDVGGPSAGLMHALAIIDVLSERDLTGGKIIAGTGTISLDRTVGRIGGIRQKVVAAEAAGATHILVPEGNYELARTAPRDQIEIVPVGTLEEAIAFLESLDPA